MLDTASLAHLGSNKPAEIPTMSVILIQMLFRHSTNSFQDGQQRFADAMERYCEGILEHVSDYFDNMIPSLKQYMDIRRRGVGVAPFFSLLE